MEKALEILHSYKNMRVLQGSDKRDYILTQIDEAIAELEEAMKLRRAKGASVKQKICKTHIVPFATELVMIDLSQRIHNDNKI